MQMVDQGGHREDLRQEFGQQIATEVPVDQRTQTQGDDGHKSDRFHRQLLANSAAQQNELDLRKNKELNKHSAF